MTEEWQLFSKYLKYVGAMHAAKREYRTRNAEMLRHSIFRVRHSTFSFFERVDTHYLIEKLPAMDAQELLSPDEEIPLCLNGIDLPRLTAHFTVV